MQSYIKRFIPFEIVVASGELMLVVRLAKLEKLLLITRETGPALMVSPQMGSAGVDTSGRTMDDFGSSGLSNEDLIDDSSGGNLVAAEPC